MITSVNNGFVKHARSLKLKKYRAETGEFLVEGEKCVRELIAHMPQKALSLIICEDKNPDIPEIPDGLSVPVYSVSERVFCAISDEKNPQGIAATARMPLYDDIHTGFILMLDDVSDPSNVGTMIRTADAAGCSCVVLSPESADCFSPKALRASMGGVFHIPVIRADLEYYIRKLKAAGYAAAAADVRGREDFMLEADKTCLIIGNESRGISEKILSLSDVRIKVPMYGKAESLNAAVAAGILMYKIRA